MELENKNNINNELLVQKEALANEMVLKRKKELSSSEQEILTSIEKKLQQALLGEESDLNTILAEFKGVLSEDMIDKIKIFLQEKIKILSTLTTEEDLEKLRHKINNTTIDDEAERNDLPIIGGAGALEFAQSRGLSIIEKGMAEFEPKLQQSTQKIIEELKVKLRSPEITFWQKKGIKKLIKDFSKAQEHIKSASALPLRKNLVDQKILSPQLLQTLKVSDAAAVSLESLQQDKALLKQLIGKNPNKIRGILKSKGITNLSSEILETLAKGKTLQDIEQISHVLSNSKGLSYIGRALRGFPLLDVVVVGIDTVDFYKQEKTDKNIAHYATKLGIYGGTAARGVAAWAGLAASGPGGWVIAGGIAAELAISHAMDVGYFDIKDFYHQEKSVLLTQEKTELKQALIQAIAGGTRSNLSLNEQTYDIIASLRGEEKGKIQTAKDAMYALIYIEEAQKISSATTKADLKQDIEARVAVRMEYLQDYLPGGSKIAELSSLMYKAKGMETIEQLLADSVVYAEMQKEGTTGKDIVSYKKKKMSELQSENTDIFQKLTNLVQKDPLQASELFQQVEAYTQAAKEDLVYDTEEPSPVEDPSEEESEESDDYFSVDTIIEEPVEDTENSVEEGTEDRNELIKIGEFIHRYSKLVQLPKVNILEYKFVSTEQTLSELAQGTQPVLHAQNYTELDMKDNLVSNRDNLYENHEYSSDIRQNIIYRIAQKFHGYTGENNMKVLIEYFSDQKEGNSNRKGLYYNAEKSQRMINNDYVVDQSINLKDIQTQSVEQIMTNRFKEVPYRQKCMTQIIAWPILGPGGAIVAEYLPKTQIKDMIDTPTETADEQLNREFFLQMKTILTEEKQALDINYKKKIEDSIYSYLKQNIKDGYVKLPGYLVQQAQQVGLGNLSYRYFTLHDNKLIAVTTNDYIGKEMNLSQVEKRYVQDTDGKEKTLELEQIEQLPIETLAPETHEIITTTNTIQQQILSTAGHMMRENRGEVKYDPLTEQISSRGTATKLSKKNGKYILDDGKLPIEYESGEEAIHMALIKNRCSGKYKKEYPDMSLQFGSLGGLRQGLFNTNNSGRFSHDTKLLSKEFITTYLPSSYKHPEYQSQIIEYLSS